MASIALTLADQITAYLDGLTVGGITLPCVRKLIPDRDLANAKSLCAMVVPNSLESKIIARGGTRERIVRIDVGIIKRAAETELEELLDLAQQVGDLLEGRRFDAGYCVEVSFSPLYDVEIWLQQHCFFAVIVAKIKVMP